MKTLFSLIPSDIKREAISGAASVRSRSGNPSARWFVNFDGDMGDFFASPFLYRKPTEDNQVTVAEVSSSLELIEIAN